MGTDGTDFVNAPVEAELPTSRSVIFVTPDGERSMNTYLGISTELGPDDVDDAVAIANDTVYGLSGGVWGADKEAAKAQGITVVNIDNGYGAACAAMRPNSAFSRAVATRWAPSRAGAT